MVNWRRGVNLICMYTSSFPYKFHCYYVIFLFIPHCAFTITDELQQYDTLITITIRTKRSIYMNLFILILFVVVVVLLVVVVHV